MRGGRARDRGHGRGAGRVPGRGAGRGPGPASTSKLPAPPVTVNERHREYPARGLTGNRRQQGNLANGLPNYTYEVI
jgi:hypothetical protein